MNNTKTKTKERELEIDKQITRIKKSIDVYLSSSVFSDQYTIIDFYVDRDLVEKDKISSYLVINLHYNRIRNISKIGQFQEFTNYRLVKIDSRNMLDDDNNYRNYTQMYQSYTCNSQNNYFTFVFETDDLNIKNLIDKYDIAYIDNLIRYDVSVIDEIHTILVNEMNKLTHNSEYDIYVTYEYNQIGLTYNYRLEGNYVFSDRDIYKIYQTIRDTQVFDEVIHKRYLQMIRIMTNQIILKLVNC